MGFEALCRLADSSHKDSVELLFGEIEKRLDSQSDISAAMGYGTISDYTEEDLNAFIKNVDQRMYEKKHQMKRRHQRA